MAGTDWTSVLLLPDRRFVTDGESSAVARHAISPMVGSSTVRMTVSTASELAFCAARLLRVADGHHRLPEGLRGMQPAGASVTVQRGTRWEASRMR